MRDRKKQKEARQLYGRQPKEEKLDLIDYCGIKDPTPYLAVKNIIRKEQKHRRAYEDSC